MGVAEFNLLARIRPGIGDDSALKGWALAKRSLLALLALLGVAAAPVSDDEALYRARFAAMMKAGGVVTHYDPMEPVTGAAAPVPLPVAAPSDRTISAAALAAATAYAAANNSRALIVWRNGKGKAIPLTLSISRLPEVAVRTAINTEAAGTKIRSGDGPSDPSR